MGGQALPFVKLHPAGKDTIAGLLSKGWIASHVSAHGTRYRITDAGESAFKARIPSSKAGSVGKTIR